MKEIAASIVILAATLILISAAHFDSIVFWILGIIMLLDGYILFTAWTIFPERFLNWLNGTETNKT